MIHSLGELHGQGAVSIAAKTHSAHQLWGINMKTL